MPSCCSMMLLPLQRREVAPPICCALDMSRVQHLCKFPGLGTDWLRPKHGQCRCRFHHVRIASSSSRWWLRSRLYWAMSDQIHRLLSSLWFRKQLSWSEADRCHLSFHLQTVMLFLVEKLYLLFVSFGPVIGQFCSGGCYGLPTIALNLIYLVSHKTNSQSKTERLKD